VRSFLPQGLLSRPDARCPVCGSSERERTQVLLLRRRVIPALRALPNARILHLAPEVGVERALRGVENAAYTSGDLEPGRAMATVDLTKLEEPSSSVDFLFVSHVLEHIPDDALAMSEMLRVLKPNGMAFVEVPVHRQETYENSEARTPLQRLSEFGQEDHVRICGVDYAARLARAGFQVEALWVDKEFDDADRQRMRLCVEFSAAVAAQMPPMFERLFNVAWLCTKPASA
jgi:SAM-dependent methyltransferase